MPNDILTLEQFVAEQKRRLDLFHKWWLSKQTTDKELYPESLRSGDWDEQFSFFKDK